jgi:uncharacterized LabA/DUF88 family protein
MKRAGFYIDGFNFYHAVHDLGDPRLKWMSYAKLAKLLISPHEQIEFVKFFTAVPHWKPQSALRHREFIKAMVAEGVDCILGQFKEKSARCKKCGATWKQHEEKETDVKIALHLLDDSFQGLIDVAYILSTDSDLSPAVEMAKERDPLLEIVTIATPGRPHSFEIKQFADRKGKVTRQMLESCLMPKNVTMLGGILAAVRPAEYD